MSERLAALIAEWTPVTGHRPWPRYQIGDAAWIMIAQELGKGGQGVVYRALNGDHIDLEGKLLPEFKTAVTALAALGSPADNLVRSKRVLELIEQYIGQMEMFFSSLAWYLDQHPRKAEEMFAELRRP